MHLAKRYMSPCKHKHCPQFRMQLYSISLNGQEASDDRAKRHLGRGEVDHTPEEKWEDDEGDQGALDEKVHE